MKRLITAFFITAWTAAAIANTAPIVSNVSASQRTDGSGIVDISYRLTDADGDSCTITVLVSDNGGSSWNITPNNTSLAGEVGDGISPGNRKIRWYSKNELPGEFGENYRVKITADDNYVSPMPVGGDPTAASWEEVNERWVKNTYADGSITMSDRKTNLMWLYDANMLGAAQWNNAMNICSGLIYAGHSDWFLPNRWQLQEITSQNQFFSNYHIKTGLPHDYMREDWFWSSNETYCCSIFLTDAFYVTKWGNNLNHKHKSKWIRVWSCRFRQ